MEMCYREFQNCNFLSVAVYEKQKLISELLTLIYGFFIQFSSRDTNFRKDEDLLQRRYKS